MSGGTHRQVFRDSFDEPEYQGLQQIHESGFFG
jgi:hypothetical protein